MREPFGTPPSDCGTCARVGQCGLEFFTIAVGDRARDRVEVLADANHRQRAREVVREVRMQLDPTVVGRLVEAAERVPDVTRPFAVDAYELLAP